MAHLSFGTDVHQLNKSQWIIYNWWEIKSESILTKHDSLTILNHENYASLSEMLEHVPLQTIGI